MQGQNEKSPELILHQLEASLMSNNVKVAPHMQECKEKEVYVRFTSITIVLLVFFICASLLAFTWMKRNTLCEVKVKSIWIEVVASSAYESVR
jgi:protein HokB